MAEPRQQTRKYEVMMHVRRVRQGKVTHLTLWFALDEPRTRRIPDRAVTCRACAEAEQSR
ncbi:hypothetical protein GCM10017771_44130 [Streptomyces capitiformicae]|uniref:Uncharacterized protein n=1 Tax=Streptomyces capitiformicae TaxID=2014920 RepID=A0A918YYN6_9ACTN|nr:hypothetical protein GCM10017771_44130 [Streptomyces capitiformicae]